MRRLLGVLVILPVALSCASPISPDTIVDPIQIEKVDVRILESFPPQAAARVQGVLGDGCSQFHSLTQERSGNVVTITILRQRPRDAICTQIAKLYVEDVRLQGNYPPGE